jgi:DNA repair protein RadC
LLSQLNFEVREVFWGLFLDSQYRVIASQALFYGTLNQASGYPREVLNACLHHHAAALIVAHNHPSGILSPSQADIDITLQLRQALALVDIELLDHIVVAGGKTLSLAETGHFYPS